MLALDVEAGKPSPECSPLGRRAVLLSSLSVYFSSLLAFLAPLTSCLSAIGRFYLPPPLPPPTVRGETTWRRLLERFGIPFLAFTRWVHTVAVGVWLKAPSAALWLVPFNSLLLTLLSVHQEREIWRKRAEREALTNVVELR